MKENQIVLLPDAKGGVSITPPQGCEVDKVEVIDGVLSVTFKAAERKLPKTWEEFCESHPIQDDEVYLSLQGTIVSYDFSDWEPRARRITNTNTLPDRATAEATLALCQLVQLRDCYNVDWVPDWDGGGHNYVIEFDGGDIELYDRDTVSSSPLFFKTAELRDEFLRNFRSLIEKLKPLYGIKEGGEE